MIYILCKRKLFLFYIVFSVWITKMCNYHSDGTDSSDEDRIYSYMCKLKDKLIPSDDPFITTISMDAFMERMNIISTANIY